MKHLTKAIAKGGKNIAFAIALSTAAIALTPTSSFADELEATKLSFSKSYQYGHFKKIFMFGHKYEALTKAKLGEGHERHIKSLDRLANSYRIIGRNKNAEGLLLKALALAEAKHGKDSKPVLETRSSLGFIYVTQNRKDEAIAQFKAASEISEKVYGAGHLETEIMKSNLALLLE